jgi:hypothetical protein
VRNPPFGDERNPTKSFNAMADLASKDERAVKMLIFSERRVQAEADFPKAMTAGKSS